MANCLVLGANGFIGSHLVDSLVEKGHSVRAFDRFPNSKQKFLSSEQIQLFSGDFLNRSDLTESLIGMDYVFHFISTTTPITAENDPLIDIETNVKQSVELFQECLKSNIKKVIFASTGGAIYGTSSGEYVNEKSLPQPISPYAIGKLTIEHYLHYFAKKHGLKSLVYRISNPYGDRQSLDAKQGVIPIFLQHASKGEPITVFGDGTMVRDYIYVKDVAQMIARSFENAKNSTYNLGSGVGMTVNELVSIIEEVSGLKVEITHTDNLATFVQKVVLDTSRFTEEFQMLPTVSLREGISLTWQHIKQGNS